MNPLWEQRVAEKEAARIRDDEAIASGRKSEVEVEVEVEVERDNYIFAGIKLGFDLGAQPPAVFDDPIPDWL
jgi:hypothetical protein